MAFILLGVLLGCFVLLWGIFFLSVYFVWFFWFGLVGEIFLIEYM